MKSTIEKISKEYKVFQGRGVSADEVKNAEARLGVQFPDQYKQFLQECGIMSFGSHELLGLGVSGYLNVVETTETERTIGHGIPAGCFVIENVGVDGVLIVMDSSGNVYSIQGETKKMVASGFCAYIESLV